VRPSFRVKPDKKFGDVRRQKLKYRILEINKNLAILKRSTFSYYFIENLLESSDVHGATHKHYYIVASIKTLKYFELVIHESIDCGYSASTDQIGGPERAGVCG